jgi:para-nitrobenzyl esterase
MNPSPVYNVAERAILSALQAAPLGVPVKRDSLRLNASVIALFLLAVVVLSQGRPCAAQAAENALVVQTASGQLRGVARAGGGAEFLGVPYAEPPVGELRWHEPLAFKPWPGIRDAVAFGAPCAQPVLGDWNRYDAERGKEDCLFLNVITPVWPAKAALPVMLWLHGGANEGGSASSALYKDGTLVNHGVLLVTVNYRLGVFGFFSHPELTAESPHHASGNYGLMDQILALGWVRDNIARFGGDPKNITIFGQSAGGQDTGLLMTSSLSKTLFQRAIAESGVSFSPAPPSLAEAERQGEKLAASLTGATPTDPKGDAALIHLRKLSVQELLTARKDLSPHQTFGPVIDGWVIARSPAEVFHSGDEAAIPLLIGVTSREFGAQTFGTPTAPDELRKTISNFMGSFAPPVLAAYGLNDGGQGTADALHGSAPDQWTADYFFRCPAVTEGVWHAAVHNPVYEYEFAHAIPGQEAQGAVHSSDLPYVFGYFPKVGNIAGNFTDIDTKLADLIESYWTNFAKTGNPNTAGLPDWPQLGASQSYIQFSQDGKVATATSLRGAQCAPYREMMSERMRQPK